MAAAQQGSQQSAEPLVDEHQQDWLGRTRRLGPGILNRTDSEGSIDRVDWISCSQLMGYGALRSGGAAARFEDGGYVAGLPRWSHRRMPVLEASIGCSVARRSAGN